MKLPREIELQEAIIDFLQKHDISPFSVTLSYIINNGILSASFYFKKDLDEFLDLIDYKVQVDKSGYTIIPETNTILLTGVALIKLYVML